MEACLEAVELSESLPGSFTVTHDGKLHARFENGERTYPDLKKDRRAGLQRERRALAKSAWA